MTSEDLFIKPIADSQECKPEIINYTAEIKQMMHGFGDNAEPLSETAKIIEEVVLKQMRSIIHKACEIAEIRDSPVLTSDDFIFLLRKDTIKLQRLVSYLKFKELKSSVNKVVDFDNSSSISDPCKFEDGSKLSFLRFLPQIDNTGELLTNKTAKDHVKQKRNRRLEIMSRSMDGTRYIEFSKARSISFANKNRHKFSDWINACGEFSINKSGYTILGYLAYETVAQIVDLAFLVRKDQSKLQGDSIDRLRNSYPNPVTYKPYEYTKTIMSKPLTPAEVTEALRRYWSPQLEMTGPFQRRMMNKPHLKFLSC